MLLCCCLGILFLFPLRGLWLLLVSLGLLFLLGWLGRWRLLFGLGLFLWFCRLGLFLLLRWLRCRFLLGGLGLFFVVLFLLCERRNGRSQQQEQGCCADNSEYFHECCLPYGNFYASIAHGVRRGSCCLRLFPIDDIFNFNSLRPHTYVGERMKYSKDVE